MKEDTSPDCCGELQEKKKKISKASLERAGRLEELKWNYEYLDRAAYNPYACLSNWSSAYCLFVSDQITGGSIFSKFN